MIEVLLFSLGFLICLELAKSFSFEPGDLLSRLVGGFIGRGKGQKSAKSVCVALKRWRGPAAVELC